MGTVRGTVTGYRGTVTGHRAVGTLMVQWLDAVGIVLGTGVVYYWVYYWAQYWGWGGGNTSTVSTGGRWNGGCSRHSDAESTAYWVQYCTKCYAQLVEFVGSELLLMPSSLCAIGCGGLSSLCLIECSSLCFPSSLCLIECVGLCCASAA